MSVLNREEVEVGDPFPHCLAHHTHFDDDYDRYSAHCVHCYDCYGGIGQVLLYRTLLNTAMHPVILLT